MLDLIKQHLDKKSLLSIGPQIYNGQPNELKSAENLKSFRKLIKQWDGPICKCSACQLLPVNANYSLS